MDSDTVEGPVMVTMGVDTTKPVSSSTIEASECIVHFVDVLLRSTLCQAQQQLQQLKHDRMANGYVGECLASIRRTYPVVNKSPSPSCEKISVSPECSGSRVSPNEVLSSTRHFDLLNASADRFGENITSPEATSPSQNRAANSSSISPALSPNGHVVSIVLTGADAKSKSILDNYSDQVAESILRTGQTPHVVASRSQLFLEGLETSYSGANHVEQFSAQFVDLVFREVFENLGSVAVGEQGTSRIPEPSSVCLEGFAEVLLQNIISSAKKEFHVSQESVNDTSADVLSSKLEEPLVLTASNGLVSSLQKEEDTIELMEAESKVKMSKPKALVHFLEKGFHAPCSETFDRESFQEDDLDDDVSRERYMEGDPALSHLSFLNQSEDLIRDCDQELNALQDKMRFPNQSIYKISYDEVSYTDQSEGEDFEPPQPSPVLITTRSKSSAEREPQRFQPMRVFESHLRSEIAVHEAETASEAGSEDIELIPHRYESSTTTQEKHLYVNKLSLATELLDTNENIPYDDDFKRIIEEDLNKEGGTVNLGFVCDEAKVITSGPKAISRISAADSGVQSEESDDEIDVVKRTATNSSQGSLIIQDENNDVGTHVHERGMGIKNKEFSLRARLGVSSNNHFVERVFIKCI